MNDKKNPEIEQEEEESFTLVLTDEKTGEETEFEYLDTIDYEDKQYIVLLPVKDDTDQVYIFEIEPCEDDPESEIYKNVESADVLNAVFELFKERNADEFNFVD